MNLKEIRTQLVTLSGRIDLVEDEVGYVDNGADFFIQEGSKFLDRRAEITESEASKFVTVAEEDFYVTFDLCRAIHEVWFYDANGRVKLEEATSDKLKGLFPQLLTQDRTGVPAYYLPINVRVADGSDTPPVGFMNFVDITGEDVDGILFPPVDRAGTLEIVGKFYSSPLTQDTSTNYWSGLHSMLLIWAALYHLEISYRNTEGAKDWMSAISLTLDDLFKDKVEQSSHNLRQMGGREND